MWNRDSYHILIYGCYVADNVNDTIKCVAPFKEYYTPMYGRDDGGLKFVGIKFDRIDKLFQNYTHDSNILAISTSEPSQAIKDLWKVTYPNIEGKCYCLIQNVYTSHYADAYVMYGYWFNVKDDPNIDVSDEIWRIRGAEYDGMMILDPGHNQCDSGQMPAPFFYGKILKELHSNEAEDYCELLAENVRKIYTSDNIKIPTRSECIGSIIEHANLPDPKLISLSDAPEITIITGMCYCCT
jgi:hypothetical protein